MLLAAGHRFTVRLMVPVLLVAGCAGPSARDAIPGEVRLDLPAPSVAPTGSRAPELAPLPSRVPQSDTDPHSRTAGAAPADVQPGAVPPAGPPESATAAQTSHGTRGPSAHDLDGTEPVEASADPSGPDDRAGPVRLQSSLDGPQPPPELAAAILGAYSAFWGSYWDAASHPVDPEHPGIGRHSTEPVRSRTVGVLLRRATEGIALRLPADHGAGRIVRIEGWDEDSAEVTDCFVDNAVLYEVASGRVRNDEQATVVHMALMRRVGDSWRVAEIFEQAVHPGRTDGCVNQPDNHMTTTPPGPPADHESAAAREPASP